LYTLTLIWICSWNLNEKSEKTWRFFQALPISSLEKLAIKIALPFTIGCTLWLAANLAPPIKQIIDGSLNEAVLTISAAILVSLLANSTIASLFWGGALWLLVIALPNNGHIAVIFASFFLTVSVVLLLERRIEWKSAGLKSAAICIPLLVSIHFVRLPILKLAAES
jgi:hypothetical protein